MTASLVIQMSQQRDCYFISNPAFYGCRFRKRISLGTKLQLKKCYIFLFSKCVLFASKWDPRSFLCFCQRYIEHEPLLPIFVGIWLEILNKRKVRRHVVRQSYPSRQSLRYNRKVTDRNLTKDAASVLSSKTKLQRDAIEQNSKTTHFNQASSRLWNSYILTPINWRREQDNEIHSSFFLLPDRVVWTQSQGESWFCERRQTVVNIFLSPRVKDLRWSQISFSPALNVCLETVMMVFDPEQKFFILYSDELKQQSNWDEVLLNKKGIRDTNREKMCVCIFSVPSSVPSSFLSLHPL